MTIKKSSILYVIVAHLDDFELSCLAYLFKHDEDYRKICLLVSSIHEFKDKVTQENLDLINSNLLNEVFYINCNYEAQNLNDSFDCLKDKIYTTIDWNEKFDILTHTKNDLHTDHQVVSRIAMGAYKHCDKYVEFYSPSSKDFMPNYFIPMSDELYELKSICCQNYDIQKDKSYTKLGYYLKDHRNLGKLYTYENHAKYSHKYFEVYNIKKQFTDEANITNISKLIGGTA